MAAPRQIIWRLEPHTRAKHAILRRYLQAWLPILSHGGFPEILYVDGFAGPGLYEGGEKGSPLIALDTALAMKPPLSAEVHFLYVEQRPDRAEVLRAQIQSRILPANFDVIVESDVAFKDAFLRRYGEFLREGRLIPTFAFIDPFGWTGTPMTLVRQILSHRSCEVFVNFMYEEINRFLSHPNQESNFNDLFGVNDWKQCVRLSDPASRNRCLHDLYLSQLQTDAKYVRSFEMSNAQDVTDYYLFYATNEILGLKKMKEAMWKVDVSGEFRFSDATDSNQFVLFEKAPNLPVLRDRLLTRFRGRKVSIAEIEEFVVVETAFRDTHYRTILRALESEGAVTAVDPPSGRRTGTFPAPAMAVRFT